MCVFICVYMNLLWKIKGQFRCWFSDAFKEILFQDLIFLTFIISLF